MKNQENQNIFIGTILKKFRAEKNLGQGELSKLSGVTVSQISRYENNSAVPNAIIIKKLSRALDVDFEELVGEINHDDFFLKDFEDLLEQTRALPKSYKITLKDIMGKFLELNNIRSIVSK